MEIIYSTYVVATDGTGQHCIEVRDDGDGTGYVWDVHQQRRINGTAFGNVPRAELDRVIEGYERYHAERRAAQATALAASGVEVGDRVEAGEPGTEDHDTGNVLEIDGDRARIGWDSGVQTWTPISDLTVIR